MEIQFFIWFYDNVLKLRSTSDWKNYNFNYFLIQSVFELFGLKPANYKSSSFF